MKKAVLTAAILGAGLAACQVEQPRVQNGQVIDLDAKTRLVLLTEGANLSAGQPNYVPTGKSRAGQTIHRVLEDASGKPMFAYDFAWKPAADTGAYTFSLRPAAGDVPTFAAARDVDVPTFAAARDASVMHPKQAVRVELMEQPETGKKIVDVFQLTSLEGLNEPAHPMSIHAHLMALHNQIFRWIHGQ